MGVHGLWRLIEPSGKPVPLETLENKVLAVDISIWLHQAIRGFQDSRGAPLPNAHLLGIYHRVCKLLYFRVRPVFVFDGGVPVLKKETISKRNQQKSKSLNEVGRIQKQLLTTLLKHSAVNNVITNQIQAKIGIKISPTKIQSLDPKDDLFKLPPTPLDLVDTSSDEDDSETVTEDSDDHSTSPSRPWSLHTIDVNSVHFKSLPADVRHEILTDLKETRKQNSWGRLHEMPTHSGKFSNFQMDRLLKRRSVQTSLEEAEQEMGGHSLSLGELESLLNDQGVVTATSNAAGQRIVSSDDTRYLLIKDVKKAYDEAKRLEQKKLDLLQAAEDTKIDEENSLETIVELDETVGNAKDGTATVEGDSCKTEEKSIISNDPKKTVARLEYEEDLQKAIQLSLQEEPSSSKGPSTESDIDSTFSFSFLDNVKDADFESSSDEEIHVQSKKHFNPMKSYMTEYSGLTPQEIERIIGTKAKSKIEPKSKTLEVSHKVKNKSAVPDKSDNVQISSSSSNSDNKMELVAREDEKESPKVDANKTEIMSDSDDSDLLEVTTNDGDDKNTSEVASKKEIIISIKPDMIAEDDLFSDIFTKNSPDIKTAACSGQSQSKDFPTEVKSVEVVNDTANPSTEITKAGGETELEKKSEPIAPKPQPSLTVEKLQEMKDNLLQESNDLLAERSTKERNAANITDQMYQEAQELLHLFGVPYLVAPMEAEAQCAFLDDINLVDGTITDDSDIWLFGGKTVYKNFFNQDKHVLEFRSTNIHHHFKLSRGQMILLALLVGSDYTTGIQGVGPVTALEILASFPPPKKTDLNLLTEDELIAGLNEFRKWLTTGRAIGTGKTTLRSKLKNITLMEGFPSAKVVRAYLEPMVETSKEQFSWGKPDIVGLQDFAREKFGWTHKKSEEILKPVIKRMEEHSIQKSIKDYFKTNQKQQAALDENRISKRVKKALDRMGTDNAEDEPEPIPKPKRTRKRKPTTSDAVNPENDEDIAVLQATKALTKQKLQKFKAEIKQQLSAASTSAVKRVRKTTDLHVKDVIPQREREKKQALKSKLKAIELFRKSKQGPGFVKKRNKVLQQPKEDAELSESSSSSN